MFRQVAHTLRLLAHAAGHDRESIQIFEDELREAGGRLGALVEAQPEASPVGEGGDYACPVRIYDSPTCPACHQEHSPVGEERPNFATVEGVADWVASSEAQAEVAK